MVYNVSKSPQKDRSTDVCLDIWKKSTTTFSNQQKIFLTYYLETCRIMGLLLPLSPQILQITTAWIILFIYHLLKSSWYYLQKQDVHFLKYLVLCCDMCSFLSRLLLLSHAAPVHPDSIPQAAVHWICSCWVTVSPTWSAANLQQEEMIKGGREIRDSLCWGPMSFP